MSHGNQGRRLGLSHADAYSAIVDRKLRRMHEGGIVNISQAIEHSVRQSPPITMLPYCSTPDKRNTVIKQHISWVIKGACSHHGIDRFVIELLPPALCGSRLTLVTAAALVRLIIPLTFASIADELKADVSPSFKALYNEHRLALDIEVTAETMPVLRGDDAEVQS